MTGKNAPAVWWAPEWGLLRERQVPEGTVYEFAARTELGAVRRLPAGASRLVDVASLFALAERWESAAAALEPPAAGRLSEVGLIDSGTVTTLRGCAEQLRALLGADTAQVVNRA